MPGRWNDERERQRREGDWRSESDWWSRDDERERWPGGEERSFRRDQSVFGEREAGAEYNRPGRNYRSSYRMRTRIEPQDYTRGGRYYGDEGQGRIYREEYGLGGYDDGPAPRGYEEARRSGSEQDERYWRAMRRATPGRYGDDDRNREDVEDRGRDAGDFLRRAGQRISNWFSEVGDDRREDEDWRGEGRRQGMFGTARGLGPKGYKRPDDRISDEVHQRLTDDHWVDASEVSVSVLAGEVTLSGQVDSRQAKHRAERIVEDVSGVSYVQNNLRIKPGGYYSQGFGDREAGMGSSEAVKDVTDESSSSQTRRN